MGENYEKYLGDGFCKVGLSLFDSEDVTDRLISMYLSLMSKGWSGDSASCIDLEKVLKFYLTGIWISCIPRVAISGQIDKRNDGIAEYAATPFFVNDESNYRFVTVQRIARLPHGEKAAPFSTEFLWAGFTSPLRSMSLNRRDRRRGSTGEELRFTGSYFSLVGDRIIPTPPRNWKSSLHVRNSAVAAQLIVIALQTVADVKSMWCVEVKERTLDDKRVETPIRLGVNSEILKSLFYARQAPLSESGRRRPILHWVRSHQRRLQDGIDIDIEKHLRGITEFEMDGFPFKITQPTKKLKEAA